MLYNTRYIPASGTNFGPEAAELPWKPPFIEGQPYEHTPSRAATAITRYQTKPIVGVDRNIWDKHFDGDDSGSGRLDSDRAENTDSELPPATVKTLRNYSE